MVDTGGTGRGSHPEAAPARPSSVGLGITYPEVETRPIVYKNMSALIDLLVPSRCLGCDNPISTPTAPFCRGCLTEAQQLELPARGQDRLAEGVLAVGLYLYAGPVAAAVRAIKVGGRHAAAHGLGELMRTRLRLPTSVAVTWVPSSRRRLRERGFDLPQLLAGPDALGLLSRIAERPDQTALDPTSRRQSPWGSFTPLGRAPSAVVLIDDVRTTSATAAAAAAALRSAGAVRVLVATLAVAGKQAAGANRLGS
jgi:predicted amidophosphoribosyltransferase